MNLAVFELFLKVLVMDIVSAMPCWRLDPPDSSAVICDGKALQPKRRASLNWSIQRAVLSCTDRQNLKLLLLPNCCVVYYQIFSTYEANNSLKLPFTPNCVLKRANGLKTVSN